MCSGICVTNVEHGCVTAHVHPVSGVVLVYFGATHVWGAWQGSDLAIERGDGPLAHELPELESCRCCHEHEHSDNVAVLLSQHPRRHVCKHLLTCVHDLLQGCVDRQLHYFPHCPHQQVPITMEEPAHLHPRGRCVRVIVLCRHNNAPHNAQK